MSEDQMKAAFHFMQTMREQSANRDLLLFLCLVVIFLMLALGFVGRPVWAKNIRYVVDKISDKLKI